MSPAAARITRVDLAAFERVALPAVGDPGLGGVVVVVELGKMELASTAFRAAVLELLGRDVAVVATVQLARHRFTDALRCRPHIRVVRVTEATRGAWPGGSWNGWSAPREGRSRDWSVRSWLEEVARAKQAVRADVRAAFIAYRPSVVCTVTGI